MRLPQQKVWRSELTRQEQLLPFLLNPNSYPHRPRRIRLVQTHSSFVFLATPFVHKVKKPVKLVRDSNTARAHELGKTGDWVVLYYDGGQGERHCTIITSQFGRLKGHRIVHGREDECEESYRDKTIP
jgi:hypothetical protein